MEDEIRAIVNDSADQGERLNALVDEFRGGRDIRELVPLLASGDAEVVSIAAWIFTELPEELYNFDQIVSKLRELTEHIHPMVRFHAFSALYPFLSLTNPATQVLLAKLMKDQNDGVRKLAEVAEARLSSSR